MSKRVVTLPCKHFWQFESPNGETSRGVCRYCGAVQEAKNCLDDRTVQEYEIGQSKPFWLLSPLKKRGQSEGTTKSR